MQELHEIARRVIEDGWNRQRFDELVPYMAEEIRFHFRGQQHVTGLEQMKRAVAVWKAGFPEFRFEILHLLQDGQQIALNLVLTGTHRGDWRGFRPTDKAVRVSNAMFFRFEGRQLTEVWEVVDELDLQRQLSGGKQPFS